MALYCWSAPAGGKPGKCQKGQWVKYVALSGNYANKLMLAGFRAVLQSACRSCHIKAQAFCSRALCITDLDMAKQKAPQFINKGADVLSLPTWRFWISSTNSEKQTSFGWQYWHHEGCSGASVWGLVGLVWPIYDYEVFKAIKEKSSFTISLSLTLRPGYSQTLSEREKNPYKTRTNSTKYLWRCLEWKSEPPYLDPRSIFHRGRKRQDPKQLKDGAEPKVFHLWQQKSSLSWEVPFISLFLWR